MEQVDLAPNAPGDLGEDDSYFGQHPHMSAHVRTYQRPFDCDTTDQAAHLYPMPEEHDHRTDAVYDDLDDIGDWVTQTAPCGMDLTKRIVHAVTASGGNNYSHSRSTVVANAALSHHQRLEDRRRDNLARDKLDRATVEQVLDPRTRMILFRLLSRNRLRTLDGCVSTGKEANVYYATAASDPNAIADSTATYPPNPGLLAHDFSPDAGVAVKVFKTSILQFKDRERYVAGEFRFRRGGYQRGSNRKMVQQWAEKEFRNQMRLQEAGIPAPVPLLLKPPILIMSFFGKDGWPAPRLKDASLSPSRMAKAYFRVCMLMRRMFRVARLVHGDLSEYNMLYWRGEVIIIDVSQSVEDDHPMALDFLRRDCGNVNDYFRRSGQLNVLSVRELFDFVTSEHIGECMELQESALTLLLEMASSRDKEATRLANNDDEVFMRSYIPRSLQEVELQEQQFREKPSDHFETGLFAKLTGLSITQKRERGAGRSKSTSASESSHVAGTEAYNTSPEHRFAFDEVAGKRKGGRPPDLEVSLGEPATVRLTPTPDKDKQRIRSSSPCTSNSSSRHPAEDFDPKKFLRLDATWDKQDVTSENEEECTDEATSPKSRVPDDTFDGECSASSSSAEWIRKSPEIMPDPLMGMSKKEWKKRVKLEARERRENKVPKHVKKRKETLAKRRRGGQK